MSILKCGRCFFLLVFFSLSQQAWAEFVAKPGKVGFAYPIGCSNRVKGETEYPKKSCQGFRLDYVEYNTNLVLAYEEYSQKFSDSFVKEYRTQSWGVGYRLQLDLVVNYFWERKMSVLSSMYLTFFGLLGPEKKTFVTKDYKLVRNGVYGLIEVGWEINDLWDVFIYWSSYDVNDFYVPKDDSFRKETLTVGSTFLGVHYSFP